jgi:hypothetical protein
MLINMVEDVNAYQLRAAQQQQRSKRCQSNSVSKSHGCVWSSQLTGTNAVNYCATMCPGIG